MEDTERLRELAASIIKDSTDESRVRTAAELLKLASEIENQRAETGKLTSENQKISLDLNETKNHRNADRRKEYITLLAPVFTTVVLAGTLILQSYQFVQSEKDKTIESTRQASAAEDVRWTDAIKLLSQSDKLSPAGVLLKSFVNSPRYGAQARQTALQILLKSDDAGPFDSLFVSVFAPIDRVDLPQVIDLNRELYANMDPILQKTFDTKKRVNDPSKLTIAERKKYDNFETEIEFIDAQIAPLLRIPRPTGDALDLHATDLILCDFQGADLRGVNLEDANFSLVNIKGAKLSGGSFDRLAMDQTAWWESSQISKDILQYLIKEYPFRPGAFYGPTYRTITQKEYDDNIARLQLTSSE